MRSQFLFSFLLLIYLGTSGQSELPPKVRPRLGVTLSGGGARGLAHIGILKAIDSAGLKIEFVGGTSMGSVLGGLYAAGYSGNDIEKIALSINWDQLFTNTTSLQSFIMEEKGEYQKYAVELPWENHKFRLAGVLESQELWLKFSEIFFPVYPVKDFSKLPRSFLCIATNVSTGEAVSLHKGELVTAIRASMAIPSIFKPVKIEEKKLVDGGIIRNFPVKDVKDLGADYVIGSNVSGDLIATEKINDIFQIITQIATFREDEESKKQQKLCDFYIFHPLSGFATGSFSAAADIIKEGIKKGNELYPLFKKMADSLNAIYGPIEAAPVKNHQDSVKISALEIKGLKATSEKFFLQRNHIILNNTYTAATLAEGVRKAFGTRYYSKVVYTLQPLPDGTAKIIYEVEENPLTFIKLILNYNSFQGVGLIANLTSRNFLTKYSRSILAVNIGDNMKIKGEHLQLLGNKKNISLNTEVRGELINDFGLSRNFKKYAIYRQGYFITDLSLGSAFKRKVYAGIGTRFENIHYSPDLSSSLSINGNNNFLTSYATFRYNNLTNAIYPRNGTRIDIEPGYVYNLRQTLEFKNLGQPINNADSLGFGRNEFPRIKMNIEHYIPASKKISIITQSQVAINFTKKENLSNAFFVGGLTQNFHNQITFSGLKETTLHAGSIGALRLGLRYQLASNIYVSGNMNGLLYDFTGKYKLADAKVLTGYSLTLSLFYLGPLQISAMYCDQYKKVLSYVNLGIPF